MCKVLRVSRSSYYNWKRYPLSKRMLLRNKLDEQIKSVYFRSKGRYGSPRIAAGLVQAKRFFFGPSQAHEANGLKKQTIA